VKAASHALVAHHREEHRLGLVHFRECLLPVVACDAIPVIHKVLRQVLVVGVAAVAWNRYIGAGLHHDRVVRLAAAPVPVVTDLVDTENLGLCLARKTSVHGVRVLLLHTALGNTARAALLGHELDVLANGKDLRVLHHAPRIPWGVRYRNIVSTKS
jgi:hypothetical protein